MIATAFEKNDIYSVVLSFDKGEKCFCCNKVFDKKTDVTQSFTSRKEYEEYVSNLKFNFNINVK